MMNNIPYAIVFGSFMYAIVCTRLDTTYAVSFVNRFMSNPKFTLEGFETDSKIYRRITWKNVG